MLQFRLVWFIPLFAIIGISLSGYLRLTDVRRAQATLEEVAELEFEDAFWGKQVHKVSFIRLDSPTPRQLRCLSRLRAIRSLWFGRGQKASASIDAAARCRNLEELNLDDIYWDGDSVLVLTSMSKLRELSLYGAGSAIGDDKVMKLAAMSGLVSINLSETAVTSKGVRCFGSHPNLSYLSLRSTSIDDCAFEGFANSLLFEVNISDTAIGDRTIEYLCNLERLHRLDLRDTQITDCAALSIAKVSGLNELFLDNTRITDEGVMQICSLQRLRDLSLTGLRITDRVMPNVAKLKFLRTLDLANTQVTDVGIGELMETPKLTTIVLSDTSLTDDGLKKLAKKEGLKFIFVRRTKVTEQGVLEAQSSNPSVRIVM